MSLLPGNAPVTGRSRAGTVERACDSFSAPRRTDLQRRRGDEWIGPVSAAREGDGDERAWVRALQRREPRAWERLQDRAIQPVFAYLALRCRRREDAEDLTAEVFAAAVAAIDAFRGDARLVSWMIGIARRKLIDAERRRRRRPEVLAADLVLGSADGALVPHADTPDEAPQPGAALERAETHDRIRRLVLELPPAQREALWLRCVDGLSLTEVARVLRRSENAVKGLLRRAKATVESGMRAGYLAEAGGGQGGMPDAARRGGGWSGAGGNRANGDSAGRGSGAESDARCQELMIHP